MPNKAFKIARNLNWHGISHPEILDALRAVKTHPCVVDEVLHRLQRTNGGRSDVEIAGLDFRKRHGLGRPLAAGLRGRSRQPGRREIQHATKKVQRHALLYGNESAANLSFSRYAEIAILAAASMLGLRRFVGREQ